MSEVPLYRIAYRSSLWNVEIGFSRDWVVHPYHSETHRGRLRNINLVSLKGHGLN